jgi:hypothetical protein
MLGVKYAASLYREIEHVWTQHLEQATDIKARAGRPIFIHSRPSRMHRKLRFVDGNRGEVDIDYVWPELAWVSGSSGFSAALWARHGMGFDEVILCGIPLDSGGYTAEIGDWKLLQGDKKTSFVNATVLDSYRSTVAVCRNAGKTEGIVSMSGWTRQELGAPC